MTLPLNQIVLGDSVEVMAEWPENSVDCIVTDPPYGIRFMGKEWDRALPPKDAFEQMIRVLKPGALAFVMSSPRQDVLWRMLALLDDVGFELGQSFISWIYKTGFPKAYDVSKGIDRKLGLEREIVGKHNQTIPQISPRINFGERYGDENGSRQFITEPASDLAKKWEGWKSQTGLKPALECILIVNKPRSEHTIVDNVLKHGVGAINVDACRIPFQNEKDREGVQVGFKEDNVKPYERLSGDDRTNFDRSSFVGVSKGRFPANLIISDGALDIGETTKGSPVGFKNVGWRHSGNTKEKMTELQYQQAYDDEGSPFRFFDLDAWALHHGFLDVAKPSKAERDFGLWGFNEEERGSLRGSDNGSLIGQRGRRKEGKPPLRRNIHSTVKPVKLMAYLIELGCPPKGIVVDPFLGSGTTCIAAKQLRRKWIGIEINPEYAKIAEARINIKGPLDHFMEAKEIND